MIQVTKKEQKQTEKLAYVEMTGAGLLVYTPPSYATFYGNLSKP